MLGANGKTPAPKIPILLFADSLLGIQPYDWPGPMPSDGYVVY